MIKKMFLLFLLSLTIQTYGQKKIKDYVEKNTDIIRTIEPNSLNFNDLEMFGKAIGDSRIVMLGEQDHGDAPTFLAKTRLIKYLHEKKGFNVLAFESDFYALNEGWDRLEKQKAKIDTFLRGNIFSIWTNCKQCDNLFYNYIPQSFEGENLLTISGFDSQVHGQYSNTLKIFIDDFLKAKSISFTNTKSYQNSFLPFIDSTGISKDLTKHQLFVNQIDTIFNQLPKNLEGRFELLVLQNLKESCRNGISFLTKGKDYMEIRDRQMSENLKWLINKKFPNQKIIVWAHSAHILKNRNLIKPVFSTENWTNMGHFFTRDSLLSEQTYILGFSSKFGTAGRITNPKTYNVVPPVRNSFETWIHNDIQYGFVDFKKFRDLNPKSKEYFNMKGKYHSYNEAVWTQVFDGVFYIRDMFPCDKIN